MSGETLHILNLELRGGYAHFAGKIFYHVESGDTDAEILKTLLAELRIDVRHETLEPVVNDRVERSCIPTRIKVPEWLGACQQGAPTTVPAGN